MGYKVLSSSSQNVILVLSFLLGMLITFFSYSYLKNHDQHELDESFQYHSTMRINAIQQEININLNILHALKAFFDSSESVTNKEFKHFSQELANNKKTIQSLMWIPKTAYKDKLLTEKKTTQLTTLSKQDFYYPIHYIYPFQENAKIAGYDLGSKPEHLKALLDAEKNNQFSLSIAEGFNQEKKSQIEILIFLPIYAKMSQTQKVNIGNITSEAFNNKAIPGVIGFVAIKLKLGNLIEHAINPIQTMGINVSIFENNKLLAFHLSRAVKTSKITFHSEKSHYKDLFLYQKTLTIANQKWKIITEAVYFNLNTTRVYVQYMVIIIGFIISVFFSLTTYLILKRHRNVLKVVDKKNNELKKANRTIQQQAHSLEIKVRQRTKALLVAKEEAVIANLAKSNFLAKMSHELRTPMHGILSYAQMGINRIDKVTPDILKRYFKNIDNSGQRLLLLLNDLLDLSKLESEEVTLHTTQCNLVAIVKNAIAELSAKLDELQLTTNIEKADITALVDCDKMLINQVIINLLSNAIKFSPKNGQINFNFNQIDRSQIKFCITDQGEGIAAADQEIIFNKFFQTTKRKTENGLGSTGLGLTICKEIITAHQGKIWAEIAEKENIGGIVCFTLPIT